MCYTLRRLSFLACDRAFHKPGLASSGCIWMDYTPLCRLIDNAHSLVQNRNSVLSLAVLSKLGLLNEGLDLGLGSQIPKPALARLLNVLSN